MEGLKKKALDLIEKRISLLQQTPSYFTCDRITGAAEMLAELGIMTEKEYINIRDRCLDCFTLFDEAIDKSRTM